MPTSNVVYESGPSDPRAAEILLRWMQRPRQVAEDDGLEALSIEQLEALHAGLMRLCSMPSEELAALVRACMDGRV
jgi:hypothetical protein